MFMEACFLDGFLHAVSAFFYASFPAPIELGRIESLLLRQPPSQGKVIYSIEFWIVILRRDQEVLHCQKYFPSTLILGVIP